MLEENPGTNNTERKTDGEEPPVFNGLLWVLYFHTVISRGRCCYAYFAGKNTELKEAVCQRHTVKELLTPTPQAGPTWASILNLLSEWDPFKLLAPRQDA